MLSTFNIGGATGFARAALANANQLRRRYRPWHSVHSSDKIGTLMISTRAAHRRLVNRRTVVAVAILGLVIAFGQRLAAAGDLAADFADPPAQWKSRPLWFWNGPLDDATTTQIMEGSAAMGYHGFGILPTKDMGVPFMSPAFLAHYKHAVDTAERLGMNMCLYDEFWFPSGSAGGLLKEQYPEALNKRLDKVETSVVGPAAVELQIPDGRLMAAVAMQTETKQRVDVTDQVHGQQLAWQAPAGPWLVMAFVCVPDGAGGLVDYLDPHAVEKFIALTYEKYYAAFPEHFGKTIDSAFYDEPTFHWVQGGRAWTPEFNARFREKYGNSPTLLYPALWYDIGPGTAAARNQMFGLRAELFSRGFVKTLADWCAAHHIALTGHVDQEEIVNPVGLCGDLIKAFQFQQIPGLDQIFAYDRGSRMYKIVSSAAVNYARPLVMTECYGAMDLPIANLYREAMDQFAKGVNLMVPHAVWYRTDPIMFPPELSHRTARYAAELPRYNEYIGRLQRVLQQGHPVVDIAVLYPIHGLQSAYYFGPGVPYEGGVIPAWADYMAVGERLSLEMRHDFTYLHPETLDAHCQVAGGRVELQQEKCPQQYRLLIVPGMEAVSAANLAKIQTLFDQGGQIIATTRLPDRSAEPGKDEDVRAMIRHIFGEEAMQLSAARADQSAPSAGGNVQPALPAQQVVEHHNAHGGRAWFVPNAADPSLAKTLAEALPDPDIAWRNPPAVTGGHVTYLHKQIDGRDVWFVANSSDTPLDTTIVLRGVHRLERWDPHTGRIEPCQAATSEGHTTVHLQLAPVNSVFLVSVP